MAARISVPLAFRKKSLSLYLRTGCPRQLVLSLYSDAERVLRGMPPRQQARPGLGLVGETGYEWQDEKVSELETVFGKASVRQSSVLEGSRPGPVELIGLLDQLGPHEFVVEAAFNTDTRAFRDALNLNAVRDGYGNALGVGSARPDLIQTLPPRSVAGTDPEEPPSFGLEVRPDGSTVPLALGDDRLRLRVIDVKLAAEPGAHYFAEVVYYSMTLAGWLREVGADDRFVVVAGAAVWPGSYEASALSQAREALVRRGGAPSLEVLARALDDDTEIAPFDVFGPRLLRFFREELPAFLAKPWDALPYHVSFRCGGCDFLGYPWPDKDGNLSNDARHCWPCAERDGHPSRVFGLSRGASRQLGTGNGALDTATLAALEPGDAAFDRSPTLRAKRTLYPARARALRDGTSGLIPDAGSDALMPRWPNLHVYVFLDYDLASAITATFGLMGFWKEPLPFGSALAPVARRWNEGYRSKARADWTDDDRANADEVFQEVFVVEARSLERERDELLKFLRALKGILDAVRGRDEADVAAGRRAADPEQPERVSRSTYQIYLWDEAQRKHLARVVGRHLAAVLADPALRDLAWLFPPPELLGVADEASYRSPFTVVSTVVQNTVAVPVPHHYGLLDVARTYRREGAFVPSVHPLFREPLTDLVPGERVHELWTKRKDWTVTLGWIKEASAAKLRAVSVIVDRLERDLANRLNRLAAPPVVRVRDRLAGVPPTSHLIYEFTRLNAALQDLDGHATRAMPAHEREARFRSAHLPRRLETEERAATLDRLSAVAGRDLHETPDLLVYELALTSRDLNARPGDIGYALSPRDRPEFLNLNPYALVRDVGLSVGGPKMATVAEAGLTAVSIEAIDRVGGWIALKMDGFNRSVFDLERAGLVNLSRDVMLDRVERDYLTNKLKLTLTGLGHPELARHDDATLRALGLTATAPAAYDPARPAAEFLWATARLAETAVPCEAGALRARLEGRGVQLNGSQWAALTGALSRRISLIWGPPGTGKSQTLRALVAGALLEAHEAGRPLRVLVASNNYAATDNVLFGLPDLLARVLPEAPVPVVRVQGKYRETPDKMPGTITPIIPATKEAPPDVLALQEVLERGDVSIVVGSIQHQIHNLAVSSKNKSGMSAKAKPKATQRAWFDLIVIDEASQVDVASALMLVSKAAEGARIVLAGDDLQLPPIHPAEAPAGLENTVGSAFAFVDARAPGGRLPLEVNYRSSEALVAFTRTAGYSPALRAWSPNLRLRVVPRSQETTSVKMHVAFPTDGGYEVIDARFRFPTERPADWPDVLAWSPDLAGLLDPDHPATCFVYDDETASQANDFEADVTAALVRLLYERLGQQLLNERDPEGTFKPDTDQAYDEAGFWGKAVGVVTPHRAQMSKVAGRLQAAFPDHDAERIRAAVDTVNRFQGQQRDVIIASFGLGDPDLISAEDEFLFNLRRFNVLASRARAKLVVLVTRSLLDHLASDADVLAESRLTKHFAEGYCRRGRPATFAHQANGEVVHVTGTLRYP